MKLCTYFMVDFGKSWEAAHVSVSMVLNQMRRIKSKLGLLLILKSGDEGKYWKGGAPVRRSSCDEIADNCRHDGSVCRGCVRFAGKKGRAVGRRDRRGGKSLAESYVYRRGHRSWWYFRQ
jgi:hypothetical protein